MKTALRLTLFAATAAFLLTSTVTASSAGLLQASGTGGSPKSTIANKKAPAAAPSSQEIADAKGRGMVWANLSTHVYHKDSSSLYGTTKRGKFMTEEDAKKAGFRLANETGASKKHGSAAASQK